MDRDLASQLAHRDHPIAAPLSDTSVQHLLSRAVEPGTRRILDLGCGSGEWIARLLTGHPSLEAVGVDMSAAALDRAADTAEALGVADRLSLHQGDAREYQPGQPFDLVLCIAATHAFGGLGPTLTAAGRHLGDSGRVLLGEGYWQHEPTADAIELLGPLADLAGTVETISAEGWVPIYGHLSTRYELDDYEWCWTGSLAAWAIDHPDHPDSADMHALAATHRTEWLRGYRESFGFGCFLLRRLTAESPPGPTPTTERR